MSLSELFEDGFAECVDICKISWPQHFHRKAGGFRSFDTAAVFLAGNHLDDFGIEQSGADLFEEVQECGASAADEHSKTHRPSGYCGKGRGHCGRDIISDPGRWRGINRVKT